MNPATVAYIAGVVAGVFWIVSREHDGHERFWFVVVSVTAMFVGFLAMTA